MKSLPKKLVLSSLIVLLSLLSLTYPSFGQTVVAIHDIQGAKSTTAEVVSPYVGQTVQTTGIVTAITATGFFIQTPAADSNPLTPEGIFVNTVTAPPGSSVVIGNNLQVTGTVSTVPATTQSHIPGTEITVNPATGISFLAAGQPLPMPIALTASNLSASGSIYQLTPYEGMRVSFSSLTAISGTGGTLNETSETYTSNGQFYAVITGTARPFRGPGIDLRDAPVPGAPSGVAVFNDNPERLLVDSGTLAGSTPIDVSTGAVLPSVTGVLDFTVTSDANYTPARLLIDPSYNTANITPGVTYQTVAASAANTFTVAALNVQRLFNPPTSPSDDIYSVPAGIAPNPSATNSAIFPSTAVDVTTAAYQRRLQKIALAICNALLSPDIIALEEVENLSVVTDIAAQIKTACGTIYAPYGTTNTSDSIVFYTQDSTGISVGFLAKTATVDVSSLTQIGQSETFTPTDASSPITQNDRPWLAIQAGIKRTNALDYPITVIVNHMQSLSGENSTTSKATREKRERQAEEIAKYIKTLQDKHLHVISVGDFNAFEFSDGYTDSLATYTNTNVLPATQVVQPGAAGLVTPALVDLTLNIPQKDQRWSFVDNGNAEVLDHIVVTSELAATTNTATLNYVHFNADFPVVDYNDATTPARFADHDAAFGTFTIPPPTLSAFVSPGSATYASTPVGATSAGQTFTITNTGEAAFSITSITTTGDFSETNNCGATSPPNTLAPGASCTANVVFKPTAAGARTGTFSVLTTVNSNVLTAQLTGTGAAADFTLTDSAGKTTTTVTVAAGATGSSTLVFTPLNGFNAAISTSCTAQGTAPAGVTCTAPPTFTLSGTAAVNQTVSFATTARTSAGGISLGPITGSPWSASIVLALTGLLMFLAGRTRRMARLAGLLALLLAVFLPAIGCGGKGSGGGGGGGGGTPAGSYTYNVTATSGGISHTETVTLTVQ